MPSYGEALVRMLLSLVAVCAAAWAVLVLLGRGQKISGGGKIRVIERTATGTRRSLSVVRVGSRVVLMSDAEGHPSRMVLELDPNEWPNVEKADPISGITRSFRELLNASSKARSKDDES